MQLSTSNAVNTASAKAPHMLGSCGLPDELAGSAATAPDSAATAPDRRLGGGGVGNGDGGGAGDGGGGGLGNGGGGGLDDGGGGGDSGLGGGKGGEKGTIEVPNNSTSLSPTTSNTKVEGIHMDVTDTIMMLVFTGVDSGNSCKLEPALQLSDSDCAKPPGVETVTAEARSPKASRGVMPTAEMVLVPPSIDA